MKQWLIGAAIVLVLTIVTISWFLAPNSLANCGENPSDVRGCNKADVIIAVSGGDTTARTQAAIDLYKHGWAPKLIFSGAAADKLGPSNAAVMRDYATKQGIPRSVISIEDSSETTSQNAENTKDILVEQGVTSAIVVSSSYHQKRVLIEFQTRAPAVQFRAHPAGSDNQWSVWWWTTPYGWYLALSEVFKIIVLYIQEAQA